MPSDQLLAELPVLLHTVQLQPVAMPSAKPASVSTQLGNVPFSNPPSEALRWRFAARITTGPKS